MSNLEANKTIKCMYANTVLNGKIGEPVKLLQSGTGSNQTTSLKGHHG